MATVISFPDSAVLRKTKNSTRNFSRMRALVASFELTLPEYRLMLDLSKRGLRQRQVRLTARLEARHLVFRPTLDLVQLTRAGWAVLSAIAVSVKPMATGTGASG